MKINYIDSDYTNYLRKYDNRISYNDNITYQRPYVGVLLEVRDKKYFAPLTTSNKGKKLKDNPKLENATFLPINNCEYGGINFNNMLPVVDNVCFDADLKINDSDDEYIKSKKFGLQKISQFVRKNENKIIKKARHLYNLKISGRIFPNYDAITCDFKKLEEVAGKYEDFKKEKMRLEEPQNLMKKYHLNEKDFNNLYKHSKAMDIPFNKMLYSVVQFDNTGRYSEKTKKIIMDEFKYARQQTKPKRDENTQEKNNSKLQPVTVKPKKKDSGYNCR